MSKDERIDTEEQARGRTPLFHSSWSARIINPGAEQQAMVVKQQAEQALTLASKTERQLLTALPAFADNPRFQEVAQYRWHSRELELEARRIVFSLCSSHQEGWNQQVELAVSDLLRLYDQDRARRLESVAQSMGVTLEFVCRAEIVDLPFRFSYQGDPWLMHPVNEWSEAIPFEAHYNKLLLEKAGCELDRWYIAEELPKPTLADRARAGAEIAGGILGGAVIGVASLIGAALGGLALLDPALVGTLDSRAEPGEADWFIIAKWLH